MRVQPWRAMMFTLAPSTSHVPTVDLSSAVGGTFTMMWVCGFCQRYSTTVPFNVIILLLSNIANEWWANAGTAVSIARPKENAMKLFDFKFLLLSPLLGTQTQSQNHQSH